MKATDLDGLLQMAKMSISNVKSGDQLLFADTAKIQGNYVNGVLTLTAKLGQSPSNDEFQTALGTVKFNNTSDNPSVTDRIITLVVNDGKKDSPIISQTVQMTGTNDAPTVTQAIVSSKQQGDATYSISLLQGAADADTGETSSLTTKNFTYSVDGGEFVTTVPAGLVLSENVLSVDPTNADFVKLAKDVSRVIVVRYHVQDIHGANVDQTVTLTTTGTNEVPVLTVATTELNYANTAAAQTVFSGAAISTVDAGQLVKGLQLTVTGVDGSVNEKITIDTTEFNLVNATTGTTANGLGYSVSVAGSIATVTLISGAGLSEAQAQTLVNGVAYRHAVNAGMSGNRVVTLKQITDSGTDNNLTALNLSSTLKDVTAPTVLSVSNNVSDVVKIGTGDVTYTYTFSEAVTGLASSDFTITHGVVKTVSGSATQWSVVVTPDAGVTGGKLGVVLKAGAVQDTLGNTSLINSNQQVVIDTVAPVIAIDVVAQNDIVNAAKKAAGITVSGTSDAQTGQTVTVVWGGKTQAAQVDSNGKWQVLFSKDDIPLDAASSTLTAGVFDQVGNPAADATRTVRIDTTAPTLVITTPLTNGASITGDADAILNKSELDAVPAGGFFAVTGTTTAEAGQTVNVQFNNKTYTSAVITGSSANTWTVQVPKADMAALAHGNSYSVVASISDTAGNPATPVSNTLDVKLAPPDVPTIQTLNTNDTTPVITGSAQKENTASAGTYIALEAGDAFTVTVGGQAYTLTIGGASTPAGLSYDVSTSVWRLDITGQQTLVQGVYDVGVSVSAVGYSTPKTDISASELVIKTEAPVLVVNQIAGDDVININESQGVLQITGTATDNLPGTSTNTAIGRSLSLSLDGKTYSGIVVQGDGTWRVDVPAADVTSLTGASYSVQASYASLYGNTGTQSRPLAVDLSAPATPNATLTTDTGVADTTPVVSNGAITAPTNTEALATLQYRVAKDGDTASNWSASYVAPATNGTADGVYAVEVRQIDQAGNLSSVKTVNFILDTTAASFSSEATASVNENATANSLVYPAAASDINAGVVYSLKAGGDATKLTIDSSNGQVKLQEVPDYESGKTSYSFTIVATDKAGNTAEKAVTLNVTDLNDNAPVFTSGATGTVAENAAITTAIYTATSTDADGTSTNRAVVYTLKAETGDEALLDISSSGVVTLKASADFEAKTSYSFTVIATNVGTDVTQTTEKAVTVNVTNVNEAPTVSAALTSAALEGAALYTLNLLQGASDVDAGDTATLAVQTLTYKVAGVATGNAGTDLPAGITLSGNTLSVDPTNPAFDNLAAGATRLIELSYQVEDTGGLTVNQTATITITGANDTPVLVAPTAIALTDTAGADTFANQTGTLSASDVDAGTTLSYGITGGTTGGSDVINTVTYDIKKLGTYGTLYVKGSDGIYVFVPDPSDIDAVAGGATPSESFTVTASDGSLSGTNTLTVNITGANDTPTAIALSANTIAENVTVGTGVEIGTLTVTDPDASGNNNVLSLSGTDAASFAIVAGKLMFTGSSPNFEAKPSYSVTVTSTDGSLVTSQAFTVNVTDVNEAPVLVAPTAIALTDTAAADTFANRTGTLSATDVDAGTTLSYGISGGTTGSTILDGVTYTVSKLGTYGTLYVKSSDGSYVFVPDTTAINAVAGGATPSESFTVTASDGSLSGTNALTVNITGANDTPTLSVTTASFNYANTAGSQTLFSAASADAVDTGQTITGLKFTVTGLDGTSDEKFTVDGTEFSLTHGASGTTTANSVGYSVSVAGSTATVTLTHAGLSAAQTKTLVEGLAYKYAASGGMTGDHVVTLTQITDSGSDNNATTLALASTVHDTTAPTVLITDNATGTANGDVTFTYTFAEAVTGFDTSKVTATGGTKGVFTAVSTTVYTLVVTPDASSTADIVLTTSTVGVTDTAGNVATAPANYSQAVDTVAPTVSSVVISAKDASGTLLNASGTLLNAGDVVTVTTTYSEAVSGQPTTAPTLTIGTETGITLTAVTTTGNTRTWTYTIASTGTTDTGSISVVGNLVAGLSDGAGNAAAGSTPAATLAIDLGTSGKLILGKQVEGKWYYFWDRSGDGTSADTGLLNGGLDYTTHDELDAIFNQDINGVTGGGGNTTNTYRYATLNGLKVALPTYGAGVDGSGKATPTDVNKAGTAVSNTTTDNPTYNDVLAIWDAHNGSGTGTNTSGTPAGWQASNYLSATPSASGHAGVHLSYGLVFDGTDNTGYYVALQVLNPATFTATSYERATNTFKLTGTDMSSLGTVGVDIKGFIDWTKFGYDTDGNGVADVTFAQSDIASAKVTSDTGLEVVLNSVKATALEADANFDSASAAVGNADKLILATNAANAYSSAANVSVRQSLAGQATIDLGSYGKLIAPVQVEGKWYYYWDRSGNGTSANTGSLNGGVDSVNHNVLDGLFNNDINGITNSTVANADGLFGTTETYRYGTLNGVKVALPTYGAGVDGSGKATPTGDGKAGTAVSNTTTDNPTYNDVLAIWDAHNGSGTGTNTSGTPAGWQASNYLSATPSASGHAYVSLNNGVVNTGTDNFTANVALQVL